MSFEPISNNEGSYIEQNALRLSEPVLSESPTSTHQKPASEVPKKPAEAPPDEAAQAEYAAASSQLVTIKIIRDSELSSFQRKTLLISKVSLSIAALSLLAASVAALCVFKQFEEMYAQTNILNITAAQSRRDSYEASKSTTKELKALQDQVDAAKSSQRALQRHSYEQAIAVEATRESMRQDQRAWVGLIAATMNIFKPGERVQAAIRVKNTGKSFALHLVLYQRIVSLSGPMNEFPESSGQRSWRSASPKV